MYSNRYGADGNTRMTDSRRLALGLVLVLTSRAAWFGPSEFHQRLNLRLHANKVHADALRELRDTHGVVLLTQGTDEHELTKGEMNAVHKLLEEFRTAPQRTGGHGSEAISTGKRTGGGWRRRRSAATRHERSPAAQVAGTAGAADVQRIAPHRAIEDTGRVWRRRRSVETMQSPLIRAGKPYGIIHIPKTGASSFVSTYSYRCPARFARVPLSLLPPNCRADPATAKLPC